MKQKAREAMSVFIDPDVKSDDGEIKQRAPTARRSSHEAGGNPNT